MVDYLENCVLSDDDKKERELLLSKSQYCLMDGVLYYVMADKTLHLVVIMSNFLKKRTVNPSKHT